MSEFTKGKWEFDESPNSVYVIDVSNDGERVRIDIAPVIKGTSDGEYKANARLIAAAPEMYKILADIVKELRAYGDDVRDDLYSFMTEAEEILARVDGVD